MQAYTASKVTPFNDLQAEWQCRMRMLREAEQFIYASSYFIQYDRYGQEYVEALLTACKRGVKVVLLVDAFGQKLASSLMTRKEITEGRKALSRLSEAGATICFYKCRTPLMRLLGSGMHIKIQLTEKGGALFSSGNISATSYDKWREFSVHVEGRIVLALLKEFTAFGTVVDPGDFDLLNKESSDVEQETLLYASYNPTIDMHPLNPIMLHSPNKLTDYLVSLFTNAKKSISLTSFYFKPVPILLNALSDAAERGVRIEIFHSHRDALGHSILPWVPSFHLYPRLLELGVHIYENFHGEHSKNILVDHEMTVFGTYNFEYAAHDRVAEAMMVSTSKEMVYFMANTFEMLRTSADNIKIDQATAIPQHVRRKAYLFKPFVRWI